jgi:membrane protein DedA with SNARE-associated domain
VSAAQGSLELGAVILAGALGAIVGDSCVYWIARSLRGPLHDKVMAAAAHPRANQFLTVFEDRAPLMLVFGRYVPGVRLVVNVTMGAVVRLPYPTFLRWSALAGVLWSAYTCVLAYAVASVLSSLPLASIVISGLITSAALVAIGWTLRRGMQRSAAEPAAR